VPVKVIHLGQYHNDNKPRSLKIIFSSPAYAFKHLSFQMSSDRTQFQRDFMKKLQDELGQHLPNEPNLTIKFIKGVPKIITKHNKHK
jgi:hypothetical protein